MKKYLVRISYILMLIAMCLLFLYTPTNTWYLSKKPHLNIFVWGDLLLPESIKKFEKETGIHVFCHYYTSNEELLVKLKQQKGLGFDLIFPSDYAVKILSDEGFLKPLEKSRLNFISSLEPFLLHHNFDPDNRYSYPYLWETYGIVAAQKRLKGPLPQSWAPIFDSTCVDYKIAMTPDPIEAIALATFYLYGDLHPLSSAETKSVLALLKEQSKWVEAYADYRAKYLISTDNCPVALLKSAFLPHIAPSDNEITFFYPEGGIFTTIENICITSTCQNEDAAYAFMNYFFQPHVMAEQIKRHPLFPSNPAALPLTSNLDPRYFKAHQEAIARQHFLFFHYFIPPGTIRKIWVDSKS